MKARNIAICLFTLFVSNACLAEGLQGFTFTAGDGYVNFDVDENLNSDFAWSVGAGYQFDNPWGIEFAYMAGDPIEPDRFTSQTDMRSWRVDGLYHFRSGKQFMPFLSVGAGRVSYKRTFGGAGIDSTQANLGGGAKYFVTQSSAIRLDVKALSGSGDRQIATTLSYH